MAYQSDITRAQKSLVLFLIDQSYSMVEPMGNTGASKMDAVAKALNRMLEETLFQAIKDTEGPRDYLDVGVIGYRTDEQANPIIEPSLCGGLSGRNLVTIPELQDNVTQVPGQELRIDPETDEETLVDVTTAKWVEARAEYGTPMCSALNAAVDIVTEWIDLPEHRKSFPPVVINATDGASSEGDPVPFAEPLTDLATEDGHTLLFNCHFSGTDAPEILFPSSIEMLPDEEARVLFRMSSELPEPFLNVAAALGFENIGPGARGMTFNAEPSSVIKFLNMGTKVVNQAASHLE